MPAKTVEFKYKSAHTIALVDGFANASPALTSDSRLYVIYNTSTNNHVYVGTADNVKKRFKDRLAACRELGFSGDGLDSILVFVVQILVNDIPAPPHDTGISDGIDVEHLLIRTYTAKLGKSTRNWSKTAQFTNGVGGKLSWSLINDCGIQSFGGPYSYSLTNGSTF